MSQCLYAYNNSNYDDVVGSSWQATQVSTISIMNFSGRIFIGKKFVLIHSILVYTPSNLILRRLSFRLYEEQVRHATLLLCYISCRHVFHFPSCNGQHQRYLPPVDFECSSRPCLRECLLSVSHCVSRVVWNA